MCTIFFGIMLLPNPEKCIIDESKIYDYCLSHDHPRGKHKAKVFEKTIGFTQNDGSLLIQLIKSAVLDHEALKNNEDEFGTRFSVDFGYSNDLGSVLIRTAWIVKTGENIARLVSCYIV